MSRNTYWLKKKELADWIATINTNDLAEWGRSKTRKFMVEYNARLTTKKEDERKEMNGTYSEHIFHSRKIRSRSTYNPIW